MISGGLHLAGDGQHIAPVSGCMVSRGSGGHIGGMVAGIDECGFRQFGRSIDGWVEVYTSG